MNVKLYVEGGGDTRSLKAMCREGFTEFFRKTSLNQRKLRVIACGSRQKAYAMFCDALNKAEDEEFIALLVDSESRVNVKNRPWLHLCRFNGDRWRRPDRAHDKNAHLMVQVMESWFLADRDTLAKYFGQNFRASALPKRQDIEKISKQDVLRVLSEATRSCAKGRYSKGAHSFGILAKVSADKVISASPYAARLIQTLTEEASR